MYILFSPTWQWTSSTKLNQIRIHHTDTTASPFSASLDSLNTYTASSALARNDACTARVGPTRHFALAWGVRSATQADSADPGRSDIDPTLSFSLAPTSSNIRKNAHDSLTTHREVSYTRIHNTETHVSVPATTRGYRRDVRSDVRWWSACDHRTGDSCTRGQGWECPVAQRPVQGMKEGGRTER